MDPELLEEELEACQALGKLPKAVLPTDLYGQCADYDKLIEICDRYGIPVMVDAAEALGAFYFGNGATSHTTVPSDACPYSSFNVEHTLLPSPRHAGKGAKAAVYSFNGNKIVTTSGGGMLASDDEEFVEKARFLSQQARDPGPHYEHSEIGYNYRMSNVLAAIGRGQLRALDERVEAKRRIFNFYEQALSDIAGIEFMPEAPYGRSNRWLTVILITPEEFGTDRETLRLALEAENIESRPVWKPMHLQPVFNCLEQRAKRKEQNVTQGHRARTVGGEVAEDLFVRGLCLPSGTQMTEQDLDRVIAVITACQRKPKKMIGHAPKVTTPNFLAPSSVADNEEQQSVVSR
jgi:dTDP-4-amino-4,6-dideoxygalactose transaminase